MWEAARATSAASTIFDPKRIKGKGVFVDGGAVANNPTQRAISLANRGIN